VRGIREVYPQTISYKRVLTPFTPELARLRLLQGAPAEALAAIRTALDETRPKNVETGEPELLAARDPCCGYAWPIPEGLQLHAEALLLQAAQELGTDRFDSATESMLPPAVQSRITEARSLLTEALNLWQPLHDPEPQRDDQNFQRDGQPYNHRAAKTSQVLTNLKEGVLTAYPLEPTQDAIPKSPEDEPMTTNTRDQVFISYSHQDKDWLDKLHDTLKPLMRNQTIDVWADTRIKTGAKWKAEITQALARAKVAVLMVSRPFLASDFIADKEIPPILAAAKHEGLTVVWVPVGACLYDETDIADYQSAIDPAKPLNAMSEPELDAALVKIAKDIRDAASSHG
jgi:hypothetical protein